MTLEDCIKFLDYRIDRINHPFLNLNVPIMNGVVGTAGGIRINRNRLCSVFLPDEELKKVNRVWQVGIFDDLNTRGISVFEDKTLHGALLKAVKYIKDGADNETD